MTHQGRTVEKARASVQKDSSSGGWKRDFGRVHIHPPLRGPAARRRGVVRGQKPPGEPTESYVHSNVMRFVHKERAKIDELLDHWQSTIHPNVIRLTQNKLFYKVRKGWDRFSFANNQSLFQMMFRRKEPDQKIVDESLKAHNEHKKVLKDYFIGQNKFVGGDQPSIADILVTTTLQQTELSGADHGDFADYFQGVREASDVAAFDELEKHIQALPQSLRDMKML